MVGTSKGPDKEESKHCRTNFVIFDSLKVRFKLSHIAKLTEFQNEHFFQKVVKLLEIVQKL